MTLKEAIDSLKKNQPDLLGLSENQLFAVTPENLKPQKFDTRLRLNFWVQDNPEDAFVGVCSREVFETYIRNPYKLAYLLCKPPEYNIKLEEIIDLGLDQLRDIMMLKHVDDAGEPNTKLISNKLAIFKHLDERKSGLATQKVHVAVSAIPKKPDQVMLASNTEQDLIKQLADAQQAEQDVLTIPVNARRVN